MLTTCVAPPSIDGVLALTPNYLPAPLAKWLKAIRIIPPALRVVSSADHQSHAVASRPRPAVARPIVSIPCASEDEAVGHEHCLLTIKEAADLLRCSEKSIRRRVKDGRLHPLRPASNRLLFQRAEIEALMSPVSDTPGPVLPSSAPAAGPGPDADALGAIAQDLAGLNH